MKLISQSEYLCIKKTSVSEAFLHPPLMVIRTYRTFTGSKTPTHLLFSQKLKVGGSLTARLDRIKNTNLQRQH